MKKATAITEKRRKQLLKEVVSDTINQLKSQASHFKEAIGNLEKDVATQKTSDNLKGTIIYIKARIIELQSVRKSL